MKNQQNGNIRRAQEASERWTPRRQQIEELYVQGPMSQKELAEHFGMSQQGMSKALKRMGVPSKGRARKGEQNGRFKDGSQSTAYRGMVTKDRCAKCGTTDDLCVHHKDEDHLNNDLANLEVLCMACHSRYHKQAWWDARRSVS